MANLMGSCGTCNFQKGHKTVAEFRKYIFRGISDTVNKSFDQLAKVERFIENDDITDIEEVLVQVKKAIEEKMKSGKVQFFFEKVQKTE